MPMPPSLHKQVLTDLLHPVTGRGCQAGSCPMGNTLPDTSNSNPRGPSFVYP